MQRGRIGNLKPPQFLSSVMMFVGQTHMLVYVAPGAEKKRPAHQTEVRFHHSLVGEPRCTPRRPAPWTLHQQPVVALQYSSSRGNSKSGKGNLTPSEVIFYPPAQTFEYSRVQMDRPPHEPLAWQPPLAMRSVAKAGPAAQDRSGYSALRGNTGLAGDTGCRGSRTQPTTQGRSPRAERAASRGHVK